MDWSKRTYCGDLSQDHINSSVLLLGWVDAIRDHGNIIFIHLRDRSGIVQVVFDPQCSLKVHREASKLRQEYVVEILGDVKRRLPGSENPYLKTGQIEVFATHLRILNRSINLPFQISEKAMVYGEELKANPDNVDEDLRLKYRYLDLRRPSKQALLIKRHQIIKRIREILDSHGFLELETPILTKSTPEGARDFLVPSRLHKGRFYALPQSPQLFKQILMVAGFERYYQVAKCFRDEDLRTNRQFEFTQLDIEASFVDEEFFFHLIEEILCEAFLIGGVELKRPFLRLTYEEATNKYGTDKPDLRYGMEFVDATDILKDTSYGILRSVVQSKGTVKGIVVRGMASSMSKNLLQNEYAQRIVPSLGGKGMTWMKYLGGELRSNIVQFFTSAEQEALIKRFGLTEGDVLLMVGDSSKDVVNQVLGRLRLDLVQRLNLKPKEEFMPVWVTHFPMFELKEDGIASQHHPFTMPDRWDFDPKDVKSLLELRSRAYDIVVNGEELGGGSIRIHDPHLQRKVFVALGLSEEEMGKKFGFFIQAFEYGAPPHGGIALGLDRTIAMILREDSIREVIPFPKNRSGICPLSLAPSEVEEEQLKELGLGILSQEAYQTRSYEVQEKRIDEEGVLHVARLARLVIQGEELGLYSKELGSILNYMEKLKELNTDGIEPTSHVVGIKNVLREDLPISLEEAQEISHKVLEVAPEREGDYFKVAKILEG
jgi:aspartyl-tRNA synthetase